jgi:putative ATP-binding cassette transporter
LKRHARDFDRRLWRRFWRIAKRYWVGDEWRSAFALLLLVVLLLLGRTEFTVLFTQQSGESTSALAARDPARFWRAMRVFGIALGFGVPVYALYYYARDTLGITWRRWLTHDFLGSYFHDRAFYRLGFDEHIDNPDQRIAEDISSFTQKSLKFLVEMVGAVLQLVMFSHVLWSISRALVGLLVVYAVAGTWLSFAVFGKPLIRLNFLQLRKEANFRFGLIRARENAEAIAFYHGEAAEQQQMRARFRRLFDNYSALLRRTLGLNLFQYAYTFFTYILPSLIVAPRVLSGELEVGSIVQAAGAFASMLGALTIFVDNFDLLSSFAAGIDRLHAFGRALTLVGPDHQPERSRIRTESADRLGLDHVTLATPDYQRTLIADLSLTVEPGAGLMVVGESGCGKSSLLRVMAGLWQSGEGTMRRPALRELLFLPQRPYMILGSLRQQLLYPARDGGGTDAELCAALEQVNLPQLVERCGGFDSELDFGKLLSVGEQQRLAIARVLLSKPRYVFLDEATSALDPENEAAIYELLRRTEATLISVAHRPDLERYHAHVLELRRDGTWQLRDAHGEPAPRSGRDHAAE